MSESTPPIDQTPYQLNADDHVVYVIYKQGVFGQGIHAISHDEKKACEFADKSAARDIDDYHSYDVYPVPLDRLTPQSADPMKDFGWMNIEPVHSAQKSS